MRLAPQMYGYTGLREQQAGVALYAGYVKGFNYAPAILQLLKLGLGGITLDEPKHRVSNIRLTMPHAGVIRLSTTSTCLSRLQLHTHTEDVDSAGGEATLARPAGSKVPPGYFLFSGSSWAPRYDSTPAIATNSCTPQPAQESHI